MEHDESQNLLPGISRQDIVNPETGQPRALPPAPPRLRLADRAQVIMRHSSLEETLDPDHPARVIWSLVTQWDLTAFLEVIKARGVAPGRAATDPKILLSIWLYAYTQGVSSGREVDELCGEHVAYQWLAGGVSLNYHTLSDFRVEHEKALDSLLVQMLATLMHLKLVNVLRIAQDGTRVRAKAGRNSFKTKQKMEDHLQNASAHVETLKRQAGDTQMSEKRKKAQQRAAEQRLKRIEQAMEELKKVEAAKAAQKEKKSKHEPAKASQTDPEARLMHMADGGIRPAYNVQFATAVADENDDANRRGEKPADVRPIVAVLVTNAGSDVHQAEPMRQEVEKNTGVKVTEHLLDGGYVGLDNITSAAENNVTIYAPLPKSKKEGVDPHQPKPGDSEGIKEWRRRMGTDKAKALYKLRAATVETVNAECKTHRGLVQMMVTGLNKVRCIALWSALAYNIVHFGAKLIA